MTTELKSKSESQAEAQAVIDAVYPGYQEPLRIAHDWIFKGQEWVGAAILVLEHLRAQYPLALKVGAELMLAYLEDGNRSQAKKELVELERSFPEKDEETLCRFGRLHREIGDDWIRAENPTDEQFRQAGREYETAWRYYDQSFEIRKKKAHYPGINRASLFLLRAWAARSSELQSTLTQQAKDAAKSLLEKRDEWPHDGPDDVIWQLASAAEANLLLENWDTAIANFTAALGQEQVGSFHRESIGKEVRRLKRPLTELCKLPVEAAAKLIEMFPPRLVQETQALLSSK